MSVENTSGKERVRIQPGLIKKAGEQWEAFQAEMSADRQQQQLIDQGIKDWQDQQDTTQFTPDQKNRLRLPAPLARYAATVALALGIGAAAREAHAVGMDTEEDTPGQVNPDQLRQSRVNTQANIVTPSGIDSDVRAAIDPTTGEVVYTPTPTPDENTIATESAAVQRTQPSIDKLDEHDPTETPTATTPLATPTVAPTRVAVQPTFQPATNTPSAPNITPENGVEIANELARLYETGRMMFSNEVARRTNTQIVFDMKTFDQTAPEKIPEAINIVDENRFNQFTVGYLWIQAKQNGLYVNGARTAANPNFAGFVRQVNSYQEQGKKVTLKIPTADIDTPDQYDNKTKKLKVGKVVTINFELPKVTTSDAMTPGAEFKLEGGSKVMYVLSNSERNTEVLPFLGGDRGVGFESSQNEPGTLIIKVKGSSKTFRPTDLSTYRNKVGSSVIWLGKPAQIFEKTIKGEVGDILEVSPLDVSQHLPDPGLVVWKFFYGLQPDKTVRPVIDIILPGMVKTVTTP